MEVTLNGTPTTLAPGATVSDLLRTLDLGTRRVAVEVNQEIVPRSEHERHALHDGDRVEVVHAIGGG
jgi:sulfur carrier protein